MYALLSETQSHTFNRLPIEVRLTSWGNFVDDPSSQPVVSPVEDRYFFTLWPSPAAL